MTIITDSMQLEAGRLRVRGQLDPISRNNDNKLTKTKEWPSKQIPCHRILYSLKKTTFSKVCNVAMFDHGISVNNCDCLFSSDTQVYLLGNCYVLCTLCKILNNVFLWSKSPLAILMLSNNSQSDNRSIRKNDIYLGLIFKSLTHHHK